MPGFGRAFNMVTAFHVTLPVWTFPTYGYTALCPHVPDALLSSGLFAGWLVMPRFTRSSSQFTGCTGHAGFAVVLVCRVTVWLFTRSTVYTFFAQLPLRFWLPRCRTALQRTHYALCRCTHTAVAPAFTHPHAVYLYLSRYALHVLVGCQHAPLRVYDLPAACCTMPCTYAFGYSYRRCVLTPATHLPSLRSAHYPVFAFCTHGYGCCCSRFPFAAFALRTLPAVWLRVAVTHTRLVCLGCLVCDRYGCCPTFYTTHARPFGHYLTGFVTFSPSAFLRLDRVVWFDPALPTFGLVCWVL